MTPARLPKISILMPSYNQGAYLEAAILSVLNQDYPNKELILIDGGSKDNSVEIIRRYESRLAFSVSEPDGGQSHALNKALSHVTGDIIGWLNSDDIYLPHAFAKIARAFENNPDAAVVYGDRIMIDEEGYVYGWTANSLFDPAKSGYVICSESAFWSKGASGDRGFRNDLQFVMDLDLFCHLFNRGRFVKINDYFGGFRFHGESKSSTIQETANIEGPKIWREHFPQFPEGLGIIPRTTKFRMLSGFCQHPFVIAFPYLYRRFILGRRGMKKSC